MLQSERQPYDPRQSYDYLLHLQSLESDEKLVLFLLSIVTAKPTLTKMIDEPIVIKP